ncbi:SDR family NAD(P)-dependent oxidoreductase [Plantibacter sp. YIM 135347]|uniref:SDR family NAD(P)-dependent oxidoreductase n=1 Tax=Plantibacter sp. YIM 135347 TaxID=3423919 RepID=UPI003D34DF10
MATALITGGTSGIGAAFARALAGRGYDLVLVARDVDRLEQSAAELRKTGRSVEILGSDLADREQVATVADRLSDAGRPIDVLVNNAGFGMHARLLDEDTSEFDRAFEVMGRAVYVLSGAAARTMRERGRGTIINVSSTAGFITMGMYSALKAFVTTYSEGLSVELAGTGVRVTAVCPGWVHTEFHERAGISTSSIPSALWIDADRLAQDGLRDAGRGVVVSIPSHRFRTLIWLARHAPRSLIREVSGRLSSSRRKPVASASASATGAGRIG